jgi:hypothetical protein
MCKAVPGLWSGSRLDFLIAACVRWKWVSAMKVPEIHISQALAASFSGLL